VRLLGQGPGSRRSQVVGDYHPLAILVINLPDAVLTHNGAALGDEGDGSAILDGYGLDVVESIFVHKYTSIKLVHFHFTTFFILCQPSCQYCFVLSSISNSILSSSAALFLLIAPHFLHLKTIT